MCTLIGTARASTGPRAHSCAQRFASGHTHTSLHHSCVLRQQHIRHVACAWKEDPLQDAMLETWSSEPDDWDVEELSDSQLIDILYEDESSGESLVQNVLAAALTLLLLAAAGNVLWKVAAVSWALVSAAVRYTTVALLLLFVALFLGS